MALAAADKLVLERERHSGVLRAAMADARAGRGRLLLVSGEAGVGKSTLLHAFASAARVQALVGACDPGESIRALGPLVDIAADLDLAIDQAVRGSPAPGEVFRLVLDRLANARDPLLVVFEDIHWADQASLDLLRFLGRRIERTRALLVATYRTEDTPASGPLALLLGDLATAPGVQRLAVGPLSLEATETLTASTGIDARELHRRTGGNPFFIQECVAAGGLGMPETVRDIVLARVARLSDEARNALEAAAAAGPRISPELLNDVLQHVGTPRWAIAECLDSGMLVHTETHLAFRHELAQSAIASATPPPRRQQLHAVLLRTLRDAGEVDPALLVNHAEAAGNDAAVLQLAPRAATRAAELSAHREAARLYAKALARASACESHVRADLLERRGHQCYLAGQLGEALSAHRAAADEYATVGDRLAQGRNLTRVSALSFLTGHYEDVEVVGKQAIATLEPLGPTAELVMAYDSRARLEFMALDADGTSRWAANALEVAETLDDALPKLDATITLGAGMLLAGAADAIPLLEAALARARERGLEDQAARATLYLGWLPLLHRRYEGIERYLAEGLAHATEHELDYWRQLLIGGSLQRSLDLGQWHDVESAARSLLASSNPITLTRLQALVALGRLCARRGDPAAQLYLDQALEVATHHPRPEAVAPVWPARAEAHFLRGNPAAILSELHTALTFETSRRNPFWMGELSFWAARAGGRLDFDAPVAEPYRLWLAGDLSGAAEWWRSRGCMYEAALMLTASSRVEDLSQALVIFDGLGARAAAAITRGRLRDLGATAIPRGPRPTTSSNPAGLTTREQEVLRLAADGLSNREIARKLVLAGKTVERHFSAILRKLDAQNRAEAVAAARRLGVLETEGATPPS